MYATGINLSHKYYLYTKQVQNTQHFVHINVTRKHRYQPELAVCRDPSGDSSGSLTWCACGLLPASAGVERRPGVAQVQSGTVWRAPVIDAPPATSTDPCSTPFTSTPCPLPWRGAAWRQITGLLMAVWRAPALLLPWLD